MSTLPERIADWTQTYCDTLTENYKQHSISMHQNFTSEWSKDQLESIKNGTANLTKFRMEFGRKYIKIIQQDYDTFQDRNEYKDGSVHAFVDRLTGEVYKPASWKSPAKIVRFDMRLISDRAKLHDPEFTGWAGGYLYLR